MTRGRQVVCAPQQEEGKVQFLSRAEPCQVPPASTAYLLFSESFHSKFAIITGNPGECRTLGHPRGKAGAVPFSPVPLINFLTEEQTQTPACLPWSLGAWPQEIQTPVAPKAWVSRSRLRVLYLEWRLLWRSLQPCTGTKESRVLWDGCVWAALLGSITCKGWNNTSPAGSSRRWWLSRGQCPALQHDIHSSWRQHDHNWQTQNPGFLRATLGGPRTPRDPTRERSRWATQKQIGEIQVSPHLCGDLESGVGSSFKCAPVHSWKNQAPAPEAKRNQSISTAELPVPGADGGQCHSSHIYSLCHRSDPATALLLQWGSGAEQLSKFPRSHSSGTLSLDTPTSKNSPAKREQQNYEMMEP